MAAGLGAAGAPQKAAWIAPHAHNTPQNTTPQNPPGAPGCPPRLSSPFPARRRGDEGPSPEGTKRALPVREGERARRRGAAAAPRVQTHPAGWLSAFWTKSSCKHRPEGGGQGIRGFHAVWWLGNLRKGNRFSATALCTPHKCPPHHWADLLPPEGTLTESQTFPHLTPTLQTIRPPGFPQSHLGAQGHKQTAAGARTEISTLCVGART